MSLNDVYIPAIAPSSILYDHRSGRRPNEVLVGTCTNSLYVVFTAVNVFGEPGSVSADIMFG